MGPGQGNIICDHAYALKYRMFLKQKQTGITKGHGCADGPKQCLYMTEEENSAPTLLTESPMISCVIDAMENCDVAIVDIPGVFMQANMEGAVYVKLKVH